MFGYWSLTKKKCIKKMGCRQQKTLRNADRSPKVSVKTKQINTCTTLSPVPQSIVLAIHSLSLLILGKGGLNKTFQGTKRLLILIS